MKTTIEFDEGLSYILNKMTEREDKEKNINAINGYKLRGPLNCYDNNYHLLDTINRLDYLINLEEVYDYPKECDGCGECDGCEEYFHYAAISREDLESLEDIDLIKEIAWVIKSMDSY